MAVTQKDTIVLKPIGDTELWLLEPDSKAWRLPMFVEWKQADDERLFALVEPGVSLYHSQMIACQAILGPHNLQPDYLNKWLLGKGSVMATLVKAPGIHPEFYYQWSKDDLPPIPKPYYPVVHDPTVSEPPPRRMERFRELAEHIARERHLPADVALVVLTAIAQLGTDWLVKYRKTLDLGFVKLVALPFRINWKEIVNFKGRPWKLASILRAPRSVRKELLERMSFPAMVCSQQNIGLRGIGNNDQRRIEYTIESIPQSSFDNRVDDIEEERMWPGETSYVAEFESAVKHHYESIVDAMVHYVKKVAAPWARVSACGKDGRLSFLPVSRWKDKVRGVRLSDIPAHIIPPADNFTVHAEAEAHGDDHLIQAKADEMQKVSAILSSLNDVRERGLDRDVDKPRSNGTNGMPLLLTDKSDGPDS